MGSPAAGHWSENWPLFATGITAEERRQTRDGEKAMNKLWTAVGMQDTLLGALRAERAAQDNEEFDELSPNLSAYKEAAERIAVKATNMQKRNTEIVILVRHSVAAAVRHAGFKEFRVISGRRRRKVMIERDTLGAGAAGGSFSRGIIIKGVTELDMLVCYSKDDSSPESIVTLIEYALPPELESMPDGLLKDSISSTYKGLRASGKKPKEALEATKLTYHREETEKQKPRVPTKQPGRTTQM